jgi:hypothetical protein
LNEVVYIRESAAIGFLEPVRISGIHQKGSEWTYTIHIGSIGASSPWMTGDRRSLVHNSVLYFTENEFVTRQEAMQLTKSSLERKLTDIKKQIPDDEQDPESRGPQGPQGPQGSQGPLGQTGAPGTTTWGGIQDVPNEFPPAEHAETHEAGGSDELRSKYGFIQITTNSNNVVLPAADIVWISSNQNVVISGFVCTRPQFLLNTGSYQITIEHEGSNSNPGNRIHTHRLSNIIMEPRDFVSLIPDLSFGRIRSTR